MNKVINGPNLVPRTDQIVVLSNGKRVANFSSPHPFTFEDGTVLPAVSNELAELLKVEFVELPMGNEGDVLLDFNLTTPIIEAMGHWRRLHQLDLVDVVFCPLPMLTAIKEQMSDDDLIASPFRAIRRVGRCDKTISITKQCL